MKYLFIIFFILFTGNCFSQVVFSPVTPSVFEVGDVVDIYMVEGGEGVSPKKILEIFGQVDSAKIILMDTYEGKNGLVAKAVLAADFIGDEIIEIQGVPNITTVEFKGFQLKDSRNEKKELIYNEIPLLEGTNYKNLVVLISAVIILSCIFFVLIRIYKSRKNKKNKQKKIMSWTRRLELATNLSSCSELWIERDIMRKELEGSEVELEAFFLSLSPDQFKLMPSDSLDEKVIQAKQRLMQKLRELHFGV